MQRRKHGPTLALACLLSLAACGGGGGGRGGGAPRITLQPLAASVAEGRAARFLVEAEGDPPLSYRWTRDGVPVAGATSRSLTTLPAFLEDAGTRYRAIVTGPGGTVVSDEALLSVRADGDPEPLDPPLLRPEPQLSGRF